MEYDLKTPEQQAEVCNVVRFAIDRSRLTWSISITLSPQ